MPWIEHICNCKVASTLINYSLSSTSYHNEFLQVIDYENILNKLMMLKIATDTLFLLNWFIKWAGSGLLQ